MVNYINTSKTMQFRVVVPANVKPGQMLRIRCPDGTEGDVRVPKGLKPGSSFIFEMPADALINKGVAASSLQSSSSSTTTSPSQQSQLQQQQQQNHVNNNESNLRQRRSVGGGGGSSSSSTFSKGSTKGGGSGGNQLQSSGFLDREILDKQDLLTALAVGILIGLSIVAGFLVGVIISTEP